MWTLLVVEKKKKKRENQRANAQRARKPTYLIPTTAVPEGITTPPNLTDHTRDYVALEEGSMGDQMRGIKPNRTVWGSSMTEILPTKPIYLARAKVDRETHLRAN